jgi:hypothetical protein
MKLKHVIFAVAIVVILYVLVFSVYLEKRTITTYQGETETFFSYHIGEPYAIRSATHTVVLLINPVSYKVAPSSGVILINTTLDLSGGTTAYIIAHIHGNIK